MKGNRYFACLLVLSSALAIAAPAAAQDAAAVAQRLVKSSGLAVQLRAISKSFSEQVNQGRGQLPDAAIAAMAEAGKEAYRADAMQKEIEKALPAKLSVAEMQKAIAWLETPFGKRITRAEEAASETMNDASLKAYQARLQKTPLPSSRAKLIQELTTVTNSVEITVTIMEATALGVALGMDSAQPVQKRLGVAALRARLAQAMPRERLKPAMAQVLAVTHAYTYRDLSDWDLAAYVGFLRGAEGKKYNDAMIEAFSQALVGASMRMGQLMEHAGSKRPA
jgi:hypothetical protein